MFERTAQRLGRTALLGGLSVLLSGCHTIRYYQQAVSGQRQLVSSKRPIPELLRDPNTSEALRDRLRLVLEIRQFAETELHLPTDGHYLHYADLRRQFAVWNVHATPEFSLQPKTWWYPVVGRLKYRGYFSEAAARQYAGGLEARGFDVFVGGVQAYSTLGWFRDPVLNTFVFDTERDLAELLFHELAHQRVFARGDTDFNEAFATAVAEEGLGRWMRLRKEVRALEAYRVERHRREQFVGLLVQARAKLRQAYDAVEGLDRAGTARPDPGSRRHAKEQIFAELRAAHEQLKQEWGGDDSYDRWFRNSLNNAKLNTVDTYYKLVPAFQALLRRERGDLRKFYQQAKRLSALPKAPRHDRLKKLLEESEQAEFKRTLRLPAKE